jgi:single-strand DNA-binding protein
LAVNRRHRDSSGKWHQEVTFVPVTAWNSMAEFCEAQLRLGDPVYIEGRLRSDRWKADDGRPRYALKVEASRVQILSPRSVRTCRTGCNHYPL